MESENDQYLKNPKESLDIEFDKLSELFGEKEDAVLNYSYDLDTCEPAEESEVHFLEDILIEARLIPQEAYFKKLSITLKKTSQYSRIDHSQFIVSIDLSSLSFDKASYPNCSKESSDTLDFEFYYMLIREHGEYTGFNFNDNVDWDYDYTNVNGALTYIDYFEKKMEYEKELSKESDEQLQKAQRLLTDSSRRIKSKMLNNKLDQFDVILTTLIGRIVEKSINK